MSDVLTAVRKELILSEQTYTVTEKELVGFTRVTTILTKLEALREAKINEGEKAEPLDELLNECYTRLKEILEQAKNGEAMFNYPFSAWAQEIESDLRAQDPLIMSFESDRSDSASFRQTLSRRISGMPTVKSGSRILSILKSNGKLGGKEDELSSFSGVGDKFYCLTSIAWAVAVIGMVITIGFLSADFWNAHRNVAIQVQRTKATPLELPAVSICTSLTNIPTFYEFPNEQFPGLPLFGVTSYTRTKATLTDKPVHLEFSDIIPGKKKSPIEDVIVGNEESTCNKKNGAFNAKRERKLLHSSGVDGTIDMFVQNRSACLYCIRFGFKKKETLIPSSGDKSTDALTPAIQMRVFTSRLFRACQANFIQRDTLITKVFASELFQYSEGLVTNKILDFNGQSHEILKKTVKGNQLRDYIDFYCNVYFFAGFFYPSVNKGSISYKYDPTSTAEWIKTGRGPYYTAYAWKKDAKTQYGPVQSAIYRDTYASKNLLLFAEEASKVDSAKKVSPETGICAIDLGSTTFIGFKKVIEQGNTQYRVKSISDPNPYLDLKLLDWFTLKFDYYTYETERVETRPTMSWPEFVTDVFEFIGLFTGICIFTLIVAPFL